MITEQSTCKRCGNCCKEGGPALHLQDLDLVREGKIPQRSLITIRKGELVHNPLANKVQPSNVELIKIVGTGRQWSCYYFDKQSGCTIYGVRPYTCRVLKCWDTAEILSLFEKDTLCRLDILSPDNPLIPVIKEHEHICPCDDLGYIQENINNLPAEKKADLEKRVRRDLHFRTRVIEDFQLKVAEELFYFGRPLFQILQQLGVRVSESPAGINLIWKK